MVKLRSPSLLSLSLVLALAGGLPGCKSDEQPLAKDGGTDLPSTSLAHILVEELTAGENHTCARGSEGSVVCWGQAKHGQLGDGRLSRGEPARVEGLSDAVAIGAGVFHTCALRKTGAVVCWGSNSYGQLGDGTKENRPTPTTVLEIKDATALGVGQLHACVVREGGSVSCWGRNDEGRLGDGTTNGSMTPVPVRTLTDVAEVSGGSHHTCARKRGGEVFCWGRAELGQLGVGEIQATSTQAPGDAVQGLADASTVAVGSTHSCAVRNSGAVACWGNNQRGQLGDKIPGYNKFAPVEVIGVSGAVALSLGLLHSCARSGSGALQCWGENAAGQLGDQPRLGDGGTVLDPPVTLDDAIGMATGAQHTCAVDSKGRVYCWGNNNHGQAPDRVPGLGPQ